MNAHKFILSALKDILTFLYVDIHVAARISVYVPVISFDELCLQLLSGGSLVLVNRQG